MHDALSSSQETGYTTVLKLLQIMTEKGLVRRDETDRTHVYHARLTEEQTQRQLIRDLLDRAFAGSRELKAPNLTPTRLKKYGDGEIRDVSVSAETGVNDRGPLGQVIGVVQAVHERDQLDHVYVAETRPLLQGARLTSETGSIEAPVEVTDAIRSGVVSIPHGWGHDAPGVRLDVAREHAGVNSNVLADTTLFDPLSGNAVLNGIPVELEPAEPGWLQGLPSGGRRQGLHRKRQWLLLRARCGYRRPAVAVSCGRNACADIGVYLQPVQPGHRLLGRARDHQSEVVLVLQAKGSSGHLRSSRPIHSSG